MLQSDFILKRVLENDLKDVVWLFELTFGVKITEESLYLKMTQGHDEKFHFLCHLAYFNTQPVAFFGFYAMPFLLNDNYYYGAQSGDVMTHPEFQRKGLFQLLSQKSIQYAKEVGINFLFAFPNELSYPGFIKKMSFLSLPSTVSLTFFENKFEMNRFIFKSSVLRKIQFFLFKKMCFIFSSKGDFFQNSNKHAENLLYCDHSKDFFQEKSEEKILISVFQTNVWLAKKNNAIVIGDIDSDDIDKILKIISFLKKIVFFSGYRFLTIGGSANSVIVRKLTNLKKIASNEAYNPVVRWLSPDLSNIEISFLNSDADVF